jgi:hypothetical protein
MIAIVLNVIGLSMNAAGVILLFFFAMPYRIPTPRGGYIVTGSPDPDDALTDKRFKMRSHLGLSLVMLGTGLQIAAALLSAW